MVHGAQIRASAGGWDGGAMLTTVTTHAGVSAFGVPTPADVHPVVDIGWVLAGRSVGRHSDSARTYVGRTLHLPLASQYDQYDR